MPFYSAYHLDDAASSAVLIFTQMAMNKRSSIHVATRNLQPPHRLPSVLARRWASGGNKETQMAIKQLILTGCSVVVLSAGTALAGPCDTAGRTANLKDAGSGPASQSTNETVGIGNKSKEHPPTSVMNRASGDVAASSQDAQRQMQGQPTAAQQAQGAKPGAEMGTQEAQRQMHAQPSVAKQPKVLTSKLTIRAAE